MIIVIFSFLFLLFNELEDTSVRNLFKSNKQFLNNNLSWLNKWELDFLQQPKPYVKRWYYFGIAPQHKERFIYSSTIFVFVTDGEHLFQFIKLLCIGLAFLSISDMYAVYYVIGVCISSLSKEIFFKQID